MSKYNEVHLKKLTNHTELPNSQEIWDEIDLGVTEINISGKVCKVHITRSTSGNIDICPIDKGITEEGGWLFNGSCTEGYGDEVIITQFEQ